MENAIASHCEKDSLDRQERKLCYLIDPIKRKVSTPIGFGMTADEVGFPPSSVPLSLSLSLSIAICFSVSGVMASLLAGVLVAMSGVSK